MSKIYVVEPMFDIKGKTTGSQRMEVKELEIHFGGQDGELLWLRTVLVNGEKRESFYMKGII